MDPIERWQWGLLKISELRYRDILRVQPKHFKALSRLGILLHNANRHTEAIPFLEAALKIERQNTKLLKFLAYSSMAEFKLTKNHSYLLKSREILQTLLNLVNSDFSSIIEMPRVLHQLGSLYENYGAFQGCIDLYSMIISTFQNYTRYCEVLFRTSIVLRYLGSKNDDSHTIAQRASELCEAVIEMEDFSLKKEEVLIHYVRCSSNHDPTDQVIACMEELFEYVLSKWTPDSIGRLAALAVNEKDEGFKFTQIIIQRLLYLNAKLCGDVHTWLNDPATWNLFALLFRMRHEQLLAVDCFSAFKVISTMPNFEKPCQHHGVMTAPCCFNRFREASWVNMKEMASSYCDFQELGSAIAICESVLQDNYLDTKVRFFLSNISAAHKEQFAIEKRGVLLIENMWKTRIWSKLYNDKYRALMQGQWERRIQLNHYDIDARKNLAYFARKKWRALFLFEGTCVLKIQQEFRKARTRWRMEKAQRLREMAKASELYSKFKVTPFDMQLRRDIEKFCRKRLIPPNHVLVRTVPSLIKSQDNAIVFLRRFFTNVVIFRSRVREARNLYRKERNRILLRASVTIQKFLRRMKAIRIVFELRKREQHRHDCARVIQRHYRRNKGHLFHIVHLVRRKKQEEAKAAKFRLAFCVFKAWSAMRRRKFVTRCQNNSATTIQKLWRNHIVMSKDLKRTKTFANIIKGFLLFCRRRKRGRLMRLHSFKLGHLFGGMTMFRTVSSIHVEKSNELKVLESCFNDDNGLPLLHIMDKSSRVIINQQAGKTSKLLTRYTSPGVDSSSLQFLRVASRPIIAVNGSNRSFDSFDMTDALMLRRLLENNSSQTRFLGFFEADLAASFNRSEGRIGSCIIDGIQKSMTLSVIHLYKCKLDLFDMCNLIRVLTTWNLKIRDFRLESICLDVQEMKFGAFIDNVEKIFSSDAALTIASRHFASANTKRSLDFYVNSLQGQHINSNTNQRVLNIQDLLPTLLLSGMMSDYLFLKLGRLTKLCLRDVALDSDCASIIADCLVINNKLQELDLSDNAMYSEGVSKIFEALSMSKETVLVTIDVSSNGIGVDGDCGSERLSRSLALCIQRNTQLERIKITHGFITEDNVSLLAQALVSNTALSSIDLSYNPIVNLTSCIRCSSRLAMQRHECNLERMLLHNRIVWEGDVYCVTCESVAISQAPSLFFVKEKLTQYEDINNKTSKIFDRLNWTQSIGPFGVKSSQAKRKRKKLLMTTSMKIVPRMGLLADDRNDVYNSSTTQQGQEMIKQTKRRLRAELNKTISSSTMALPTDDDYN